MLVIHEDLNPNDAKSKLDAVRWLYRLLIGCRAETRRMKLEEMEVRLVAHEGGVLWINTGDVQYDTHHGAACAAGSVTPESTEDEMFGTAESMVDDVCDQLSELATEAVSP